MSRDPTGLQPEDTNHDEVKAALWVYQRLAGALTCGARQYACGCPLRKLLLSRVLAAIPPPPQATDEPG
jgi:hypothetical protein